MSKVRIGLLQTATILANLVYGKAIGYTSGILARAVGNDAWIAMTTGFLTGFPILAAMVWLARRQGAEAPMSYIPRLTGRFLGTVIMLLLALFFAVSYITSAITIEQHINDYLMTETPLLVFVIGYNLIIWYGVYLGIEVAGRLSVLGLLLTAFLNLSMMVGSLDNMRPERMLPLFDHGIINVLAASLKATPDVSMATAATLLLLPLTDKPARWLKYCAWGLALGAVLVLTWTIFEVAVLGPVVTAQYLIACMQMARAAELSIYLHRYEMIMVVLFVYGVITQSVVCLYCTAEFTAAVLPWKFRRPWFIGSILLLTLGPQYFLAYDRDRYGAFLAMIWPPIAGAIAYGLPLLLCAVALLRPGIRAGHHAKSG